MQTGVEDDLAAAQWISCVCRNNRREHE